MTGPTQRVNKGVSHSYLLDGEKVPGVTTIIGNGLPKPALIAWGIRTVAEHAVDNWDDLATLPASRRLKKLRDAPYADRDAAANKGTKVHRLGEQLVAGNEVDVPDELAGHVESYVRFLDEWQVRPLVVERPVFSRRWRYGGTLDLIADLCNGQRLLLDIKTNRTGPFGEVALQLAAYRFAEFYLDTNDDQHPMPEVDGCAVIWVRADGYDLIPYTAGPEQHRAFLHVAQVAAFAGSARDLKGEALPPPGAAA